MIKRSSNHESKVSQRISMYRKYLKKRNELEKIRIMNWDKLTSLKDKEQLLVEGKRLNSFYLKLRDDILIGKLNKYYIEHHKLPGLKLKRTQVIKSKTSEYGTLAKVYRTNEEIGFTFYASPYIYEKCIYYQEKQWWILTSRAPKWLVDVVKIRLKIERNEKEKEEITCSGERKKFKNSQKN